MFKESTQLADKLYEILTYPLFDGSDRNRVSHIACSISFEHWDATRGLLADGLFTSGLVVHRAQYEALVRSVWVLHAANDIQLGKLVTVLDFESEQAAKNLPQTAEMISAIFQKAPAQAYEALSKFKENSWKALNSYVHSGIHAIRRHEEGCPAPIMDSIIRNTNGLAMISGMQAASLTGNQSLMKAVHALNFVHSSCLPPLK